MLGVLGDLVEDIVIWLHEPIRTATDNEVAMYRRRGGSAANVAAFAGPTHPTRFLGCVGPDAVGDSLVGELASHAVDVRVQRRGTTGTIVVLIDEHGERTMLPHRGAATLLADVDQAWTDGLTHLHVPGYSFAGERIASTASELIGRTRRQGGSVSVDASSTGMLRHYGSQPFLRLLTELRPDFLLANRGEAALLGLIEDRPDFAHTVIVIKDGDRPTTVLRPGEETLRVDVAPVADVRDLTGAGDAFAAGFLTAVLRHADLRTACEEGHASAASVLRSPGAASG